MPTIDGRTRLRRVVSDIANDRDEHNARQGLGPKAMFGVVVEGFPDIQVVIEGLPKLTEESLYLTRDLLLIPDTLRIAQGDRLVLLPCQGDKGVIYLVLAKLRTSDLSPPDYNAKLGFNGDIIASTGGFVGVEVAVVGGNEGANSVVSIFGDIIEITSYGGANVIIDGINFKTHTHSDPQGGTSGPPV